MKKYIKYYCEREKKFKRFAANKNLTINTIMHADYMEVQFKDEKTDAIRLAVHLYIADKKIEKYCEDVIFTKLNCFFEKAIHKIVGDDLAAFLSNDRRSLPVDKVVSNWNFLYNLFLTVCHTRDNGKMEDLANKMRILFDN